MSVIVDIYRQLNYGQMQEVTRQQIIDEARKYIGAPYRHMGRSKEGIDCIGLLLAVGQALGQIPVDVELPPYQRNGLFKNMDLFWEHLEQIPVDDIKPGDGYILCHDEKANRRPRHLGFATELGILWLHWSPTLYKVCEHRIPPEIEANIVGAFRFKGLID